MRMAKRSREAFLVGVRPEISAGGYARDDSSVNFFSRVNALLSPEMTVVDLGAGRGASLLGEEDFLKRLRRLQGKVTKVIGIDVDEAIAEHPFLDERHIVAIGDTYPLESASVDLVVCDWVLEHVAEPDSFAREIHRVLRPGGWFCARTPNRLGYVGIVVNVIPHSIQKRILSHVWPERQEVDVFPTVYKLNTRRAIRKIFPASLWDNYSYFINPPPKYHGNVRALFAVIGTLQSVAPAPMKTDMIVVLRKAGY